MIQTFTTTTKHDKDIPQGKRIGFIKHFRHYLMQYQSCVSLNNNILYKSHQD